jgi:hypothetical protein
VGAVMPVAVGGRSAAVLPVAAGEPEPEVPHCRKVRSIPPD